MRQVRYVTKQGETVDALNSLVSNSGDMQGYDQKDLLRNMNQLMAMASSGQIVTEEQYNAQHNRQAKEERREVLASALASDAEWQALGSSIGEKIFTQADRAGFLRRLAQGDTLRQGEQPKVVMDNPITEAIVASSISETGYQYVNNKVFNPTEFEIIANLRVAQLDLDQISGDLLDKAYNEGLEAIMVQEDRMWKKAADQTVGVVNPLTRLTGKLTPGYLSELRTNVTRWNLPATTALISTQLWNDVHSSDEWATMLDPVTRHELVLTGQIGTLQGMNMITDGYRAPNQKVLDAGEMYCVAEAKYHAAYTTRGAIRSTPTDGANDGSTGKGWLLAQPFSFILANMRSVAKATRF